MTDAQFLRRPEDELSPPRRVEEQDGGPSPAAQADARPAENPAAPVRPLSVPTPRLRYASPALDEAPKEPDAERVQAITRAALEVLGGAEDRAQHLLPEDDVLGRVLGDEPLDLLPRSDLIPLVPEEQSRALGNTGRDQGQVSEQEYRREAELKPDDLDEIARERRELVQSYYAEQGHALIDPGEITQLAGPPAPEQTPDGQTGPQDNLAQPPSPVEDLTAQNEARTRRTAATLRTEGGERALRAVTERLSAGFQSWLRRDGLWHKRSEWLKKQLSRSWEIAPDALNPHILLLAPKGRPRLASYIQTDAPDAELQNEKLSEQDRAAQTKLVGARTRSGAASRFERQIREARQAAVLAVSKTVSRQWAEAMGGGWSLDAAPEDADAPIKTPQNQGVAAWLDGQQGREA